MTNELEAFINHFANEDELRSAIEGLLSKREDCTGIRSLHGKDECGKDIIFYAPAGLGGLRLNACVVKSDKINGSASDPKSGARNVLIQCDQAIDTPVINTRGLEEWVDHVYIMCPNELSATAMQSISGAFRGKASQIDFICGQDLLQLFKQLWPDFIFFQPDLLSAHLDSLGKELASDSNIHRLATVHGLNPLAQRKNIYVEPSLFQLLGRLSRDSPLLERSQLLQRFTLGEIDELSNVFRGFEDSLRVVDYLPPEFRTGRDRAERDLRAWPGRLKKDWSDAHAKASNEARTRKEAPPGSVALPNSTARDLLESRGIKYLEMIYTELDEEIESANASVTSAPSNLAMLDDVAFANYASLLHATSTCFPTIKFAGNGEIGWAVDDLFSVNRNLLITGPPGYGKTSFSRNHFLADVEKFRANSVDVLPLYFAAHKLEVTEKSTFKNLFVRHEVASRLQSDPSLNVRLYLDGLDEVTTKEERDRILAIVKEACTEPGGRVRCIATAREHVGGFWTNWLIRVRLSPMSAETLRELVTAWLDGDSELISRFYAELERSEALTSVLQVPLLATLTVLVFKNLRRLPENRLRLYQMFIDLLLGGWNLAKGLQRSSTYSSTSKMIVLTRLAGIMHRQKTKECSDANIAAALGQSARLLLPKQEGLVAELIEDGLLLPSGRMTYMFPHLSFQEYLAAKDAMDPSGREEQRIVKAFLNGDDWYKEVATFLVSMTTNPVRMRAWIVDLVKPLAGDRSLSDGEKRAAYLISKLGEMFPECKPVPSSN